VYDRGMSRHQRRMFAAAALLLAVLLAADMAARGQGVASRGVKPQPRGKPSGLPFHARFVDVAREAGLTHPVIYGPVDRKAYIVETIGSGVALVDYDGDGWLDIFLLSGTRFDDPPPGATNRLYRNNRDGTFSEVTKAAGLARTGWASSVAVADYDGDGNDDLFVTFWGSNALYRNRGDGRFEDVTREAGLLEPETRWGSGATFLDYDRDGDLDLFVANYLVFDLAKAPRAGEGEACRWKGVPVNCGPRGLPTGRHSLYRNEGSGRFTDVSRDSGVDKATGSYGMTAIAADLDNDGWSDVYVASDSTPSQLLVNGRDGTFSEEGVLRGAALSENGMEQAGMGIAVGDYDRDGDLDLFKTHFADDTNGLYRNDGAGNFEDVTMTAGLGVETRYVGWGAALVDLDHDGPPDILYVTGNVYPEVERTLPAYPFRTPRVVFRSLGNGRFEELFEEAGPAIAASHPSRGAAFGDIDNDGDIDAVVVNLNEIPSLLRNDLDAPGHWLTVKLEGRRGPASPVVARVTAVTPGAREVREVLSQASFYSADDKRLHFGLGPAASADLEVRWPDGRVEVFKGVTADQFVVIKEGSGITGRYGPGWIPRQDR
jgi:enediyne biosynthesis protein E4